MLELRKRNGNVRAISYGWISKIDYDPSTGIILYAGEDKVALKGRNLNLVGPHPLSLVGGLLRHRITWIAEANQETILKADKDAVMVETIQW